MPSHSLLVAGGLLILALLAAAAGVDGRRSLGRQRLHSMKSGKAEPSPPSSSSSLSSPASDSPSEPVPPKTQVRYTRVGSMLDMQPESHSNGMRGQGGVVLMGGGDDVDDAFVWMCKRSGGGDFLVIRAAGTDAYNPYIRDLCRGIINSVATLIISSRDEAQTEHVKEIMGKAEAIFIAGGDQSMYINWWTGTYVQSSLNSRIMAGIPVGGTSAGMNVLTSIVYSAEGVDGVQASEAVGNPFNIYMTFAQNFVNSSAVPALQGIVGDPHFTARDRLGRSLAFMCRAFVGGWSADPRAIAVDEATALLLDGSKGVVVGSADVYFFHAPNAAAGVCEDKTPVSLPDVTVYRTNAPGTFNLQAWRGTGGVAYNISITHGAIRSTQPSGLFY